MMMSVQQDTTPPTTGASSTVPSTLGLFNVAVLLPSTTPPSSSTDTPPPNVPAFHNKPLLAPVPLSIKPSAAALPAPTPQYSSDSSDDGDCSSPSSHLEDSESKKEKRSTKSKCPPGLRSGKWTPEEEAFTNKMIHFFRLGLLDIEDGTSLRWYLSKKLNCEAMRVTKKLKGNSSIGKQIFRALDITTETTVSIQKAAAELQVLEDEFFSSLSMKPAVTTVPPKTTPRKEARKGTSTAAIAAVGSTLSKADVVAPPFGRDEAELLLHFCLTAHRGEKRKLQHLDVA
ncbi:Aste57867_20702 [Aphanomyces stellatus]|uniref:Aste57867_20702 protein n=1 Tax=Aphanomyces stellatus TaxID=120398 RepID=A0A485LG77_9STRA|nr:hypothetical protein As57867_020634 [Aphanomyces stellatus]VFT97382.1 Aste57867_20702 [Aphanomyces stellatus]